MRDISHISIVFVILLALISGLTASVGTTKKVTINPFIEQRYAAQAVSQTQERLYEADTVATLSGIYSEKMGQDAIKEAENLNSQLTAVSTTSSDYVASQPIVAVSDTATRTSITKYVVLDGETVWSIARKFNITTDTIRFNNKLEDENSVKPGQTLVILPVPGVLHTVSAGDTLASISKRYGVSEAMIVSQNDLYGEDLKSGMQLVIPDAEIPEAPKPAPAENDDNSSSGVSGFSYVKLSTGPNHFPYGYCTWWVAQKRYVPWNGDAWQWYGNAQAYGRPVGKTPIPGAIMVTWESGIGHVAYVESVSGGSFTVSEMNYRGYGIVSTRTITTSQVPLIGFIY